MIVDSIVLANVHEWDMQPERRALLAAQHDLVHGPYPPDDLAFLWSGDNKVVLCRDMVDEEYWEDLRACLAYTAVHHLEVGHSRPPRSIGDLVVRDAERIAEQIRRLVESEDDECPINVRVWGATPEVYDAVVALQHRMKRSLALEGPSAVDYWSVSAFDTKTHGRELLGLALARHGDPSVKVPLGFSVKGSPSASPIVRLALRLFDGAMVKPEAGSGGSGIVFVSDASDERVLKSVQRLLDVDGCVVEEYVATQNATPIGFNGIVHPDGQVAALGAVRQHIVDRHRFLGFEAGRGVLDPELLSKIAQVGSTIGKVLYEVGLKGPFNVGFVHQRDSGDLYALEVNPRRSGSSGILEALAWLYGADWAKERTVVAREHIVMAPWVRDYRTVKRILERENVLDPKGLFVFPYTVSGLPTVGECGLLAVGDGLDTTHAAMHHVTSCFGSK